MKIKVLSFLFYLTIFSLGFRGINISGIKIADGILLFAVLILIWERNNIRINSKVLSMFGVLYFLVLLSMFRVENFYFSIRDVFRYPLAMAMFLLVTNCVDSPERFRKIFLFTILVGAACAAINLSLFGLWSRGIVFSSLLHVATKGVEGRVEAFFYDPNHYASFLIIPGLFSMLYPLHYLEKNKYKKTFFWLVVPLLIFCGVIVTGSRVAVISFIIGLTVIIGISTLYLMKRVSRKNILLTIVLTAMLICCVVVLGYFIKSLVSSPESYTKLISFRKFRSGSVERAIFKRGELWKGCLYAFIENPLNGVGTSNFINVYPDIADRYGLGHNMGQFPHNTYLGVLAEVGLIGFIFELLILAYIFSLSFKCLRIGYNYNLSIILIAAFFAVTINMFFLDMIYARRVWLLFGLIASYHRNSSLNFQKEE